MLALPALAIVGTGAMAGDLRRQAQEDLQHQGALLALHVGERWEEGPALEPLLVKAKAATLSGIRVVDRAGRVVAASGPTQPLELAGDPLVRVALAGASASEVRPKAPGSRASDNPLSSASRFADVRVFVATPVLYGDQVVGAVVLSRTPREEVQAIYHSGPALWGGALAATLCTVLLSLWAARVASRSLAAMAAASERIAVGGDPSELAVPADSAIAETRAVARAMAAMSARLRARLAYIREFAGNVSHEFKTPVASARGALELLRDDPDMVPAQRDRFLLNALADLDRMDRLVAGLLRLARAEEGGPLAPVDLDALAGEIAARHAGVAVAGSAGAVTANRELLDAAISNLVDNAIRHGAPPIELVLGGDATVATVEVVDHGPGISEGNAARIFERFFTTARAQGGTGLGLALARAVAEGLGGSIHVACEQGETRFVVRIPRGLPSAPAGG